MPLNRRIQVFRRLPYVDVLDVEDAFDNPDALLHVQCAMRHARHARKGLDGGPVGTEHGIGRDKRAQRGDDVCGIEFFQSEIGRFTTPVTHHQNGDLIRAGATGFSRRHRVGVRRGR